MNVDACLEVCHSAYETADSTRRLLLQHHTIVPLPANNAYIYNEICIRVHNLNIPRHQRVLRVMYIEMWRRRPEALTMGFCQSYPYPISSQYMAHVNLVIGIPLALEPEEQVYAA